jgi:hypothetical protein
MIIIDSITTLKTKGNITRIKRLKILAKVATIFIVVEIAYLSLMMDNIKKIISIVQVSAQICTRSNVLNRHNSRQQPMIEIQSYRPGDRPDLYAGSCTHR